jgi:hypothetical protein
MSPYLTNIKGKMMILSEKQKKQTAFYWFLSQCLILFFLSTMISCHGKQNKQDNSVNIDSIENKTFTLDFKNDNVDMANIENFFFTTFPHNDPTRGDVVYDRQKWINANMIKLIQNEGLYLYIKQRNGDNRFDSVRMTSKVFYNINENMKGLLFIFKGTLPSNKGIWPAWWLNGSRQDQWLYREKGRIANDNELDAYSGIGHFYDTPSPVNSTDWPSAGEIDIIETINGDHLIHNTIHTCPNMCDTTWNKATNLINCANAKPGVDPNPGCSGTPFYSVNAEGTFVCFWKEHSIQYYYWEPDAPVRKKGGPLSPNPDPMQWKNQLKNEVFLHNTSMECDAAVHQEWQCKTCEKANRCKFKNMKMIFNITLCGTWAGNQFDKSPQALQNCKSYINNEGKNKINDQFMKIEYISVKKIK